MARKLYKVKVKEYRNRPGLVQTVPEDLRSQIFNDIRHMKLVTSPSRTGRLYPQECCWYSFSLGAESPHGHGAVGRNMSVKNSVTPPGIDPGTVRLVAQRLNHYATPDP
jgi:hypothetical protein